MHARRDGETEIGGREHRFPRTRHSAIVAARADDPLTRKEAWETISAAYWKPVYAYVRARWKLSNDDAKELTQDFLLRAFEKSFFSAYDATKGTFRTFLRTCLDRHVAHELESRSRQKRGGDRGHVDIDEDTTAPGDPELERLFHREWVRGLFEHALEELRAACERSGKARVFALFQRYDVEGPDATVAPTYAGLAAEHGVPVTQVTNDLAWARREFKARVRARLRAICADDDEFEAEARALLGEERA